MSKKISQAGIDLIKSFEGCRLTAYKPVATETYYTIGYGHYGADVAAGMTITQEQAEEMLVNDLVRYEAPVNNPAYVPFTSELNQNQFDALVSFCYNCGAGNLKGLCEGRTIDDIPNILPLYNKGGGKVLAGLVRRRKAEVDLFLTPVVEKGARKLELKEDWQWTMLGNALTALSQVGGGSSGSTQLLSYEWASKAYSKELTVDDALFVLTIALARSQRKDVD